MTDLLFMWSWDIRRTICIVSGQSSASLEVTNSQTSRLNIFNLLRFSFWNHRNLFFFQKAVVSKNNKKFLEIKKFKWSFVKFPKISECEISMHLTFTNSGQKRWKTFKYLTKPEIFARTFFRAHISNIIVVYRCHFLKIIFFYMK